MDQNSHHTSTHRRTLRDVIVPVIDLKDGRVVRAQGGDRSRYAPWHSPLQPDADPETLARVLRESWGFRQLYVADLDAIKTGRAAIPTLSRMLDPASHVWIDAGLRTAADAAALASLGPLSIVAATETLAGPDELARLVATHGPGRVVLSLDLRQGRAIVAHASGWPSTEIPAILASAQAAGVRRILVLNLDRVGTGHGAGTTHRLARLSSTAPELEWNLGGGISTRQEVQTLLELNFAHILIATALHEGTLGLEDPHDAGFDHSANAD